MKKCILFCIITLGIVQSNAQDAHELIHKMSEQMRKLKSLKCEVLSLDNYYGKITSSHIYTEILFDQNSPIKPLIKGYRYNSTCTSTCRLKNIEEWFFNKKNYMVFHDTHEARINELSGDELDAQYSYLNRLIGPITNYSSFNYLDSLFSKTFHQDDIDMTEIKYNVAKDTACLSRDCYKVTISVPANIAIQITEDESSTYEILEEINTFWINSKTYLPERYKFTWATAWDSIKSEQDFHYLSFEKDYPINESSFQFNPNNFKHYRIIEYDGDKLKTIQEGITKAPDFHGKTSNGSEFHLYETKAKLFAIVFWQTKHPINKYYFDTIQRIMISKYSPDDLCVIGVNVSDSCFEAVNQVLNIETTPPFPFLTQKDLNKQFCNSSLPCVYFLNEKYEVIRSFSSINDSLFKEMEQLLNKKLKK